MKGPGLLFSWHRRGGRAAWWVEAGWEETRKGLGSIQSVGLSSKAPRASPTLPLPPFTWKILRSPFCFTYSLGRKSFRLYQKREGQHVVDSIRGMWAMDCGTGGVRKCLGQCYLWGDGRLEGPETGLSMKSRRPSMSS